MNYIYYTTSLVVRNPVEIVKVQIINVQDCRSRARRLGKVRYPLIEKKLYTEFNKN